MKNSGIGERVEHVWAFFCLGSPACSGYFAKSPEQYKNNYYLGVVYVSKIHYNIVLLINGSTKKDEGRGKKE